MGRQNDAFKLPTPHYYWISEKSAIHNDGRQSETSK